MKLTYVWNNDQTLESYLDGIITDPDQTHIYNAGPEWEIGDLEYSDFGTFCDKLAVVEQMVQDQPDLANQLIYLRGCHTEQYTDTDDVLRLTRPDSLIYDRIEGLFGHTDYMWNYLLWQAMDTFRSDTSNLLKHQPDQLFCCMQHRPHPHRVSAMLALCDTGLSNRGKCTFANSPQAWQAFQHRGLNSESKSVNMQSRRLLANSRAYSESNRTTPQVDSSQHSWNIIPDYHRYLFDIVVESTLQTTFFTEKTFKPIFWGKPFVILGSQSQNTQLSDLGYETFPEYFDLTSDSDTNFNRNINKPEYITQHYHKIISPLSEIPDSDIPEIYKTVKPKITHNHSVMVKHLFDDDIIPEYIRLAGLFNIDDIRTWLTHDTYFGQFV